MNTVTQAAVTSIAASREGQQLAVDTARDAVNGTKKVARILGIGILSITAYLLLNKAVKRYKSNAQEAAVEEAINNIPVNSSGLTITEQRAQIIAANLYAAMEKTGTDEQAIMDNLNNLTTDDLKLVYKTFGRRAYGTFGSPAYSWLPSTMLDLGGWFRRELSGNMLNQVVSLFATAGITF